MAQQGSTHQLIDIKEIKDNIVVLKNNGLRMVLMVSSINFALKSQDEQEAIVARFQDFVNSLDFTIQIVIQSRQLDISEYLNFLNERSSAQTNELLKIQTTEYLGFIQELIKLSNVMSKFFYVVVPLGQAILPDAGGILAKIFPKSQKNTTPQQDLNFETAKNELQMRVDQVASLLGSMGLKAIPLEKEALIELYYTGYNPGTVLKQKNLEQLIATGDEAKKVE